MGGKRQILTKKMAIFWNRSSEISIKYHHGRMNSEMSVFHSWNQMTMMRMIAAENSAVRSYSAWCRRLYRMYSM